ncbi:Hypp9583 [Branchiostoma lanceolatum]|uniref:Hypp9583 protein n=1 Tax=Branchiostoma lanceolatum TaxID=7740 RepID=A0A8S4MN59_BRALA|nr:Hypp9583 [Branchiostoma lanceolatum]
MFIGKQPAKPDQPLVWVLSENLQLGEDGEEVPTPDRYLWELKTVPPHVVDFDSVGPQDRTGIVLQNLLLALKAYLQPHINWPAGAVMVGGLASSLNYDLVIKSKLQCPVVMASGPSAVGKSTALRASLSLVGSYHAEDFSELSALVEAATSSLPFGWDDPLDEKEFGRVVMKVSTSVTSRLAVIPFIETDEIRAATHDNNLSDALEEAKAEAPRAIASLISLGKVFLQEDEQASLNDIETRLAAMFPPGSLRTAQVYALVVWFTQEVLSIAGLDWTYMSTTVAQLVTNLEATGAAPTAGDGKTEVIAAVAAALQSLTLRQINMSIRVTDIYPDGRKQRVIAIYPEMLQVYTGDRRLQKKSTEERLDESNTVTKGSLALDNLTAYLASETEDNIGNCTGQKLPRYCLADYCRMFRYLRQFRLLPRLLLAEGEEVTEEGEEVTEEGVGGRRGLVVVVFAAERVRRSVVGKEVGEEGTPHLQGFINLRKKVRLAGVKKIVGDRAYVSHAVASDVDNDEYCSKGGNLLCRIGEPSYGGKRNDLEAAADS